MSAENRNAFNADWIPVVAIDRETLTVEPRSLGERKDAKESNQ